MGERQSDGGRAGRRRVPPEGAPPAHTGSAASGRSVADAADLEALLVSALTGEAVDTGAEQRAVAAFVTARESGAHDARTRRRDDWRPRRGRFGSRSLKATLSVLIAGLTLSGVAVAGIGGTDDSPDAPERETRRSHAPSGTDAPAAPEPDRPGGDRRGRDPDRPETAQDTEARCRAYERVEGRGGAMEATAWQRLVRAAGGAEHVGAYCAGQRAQDPTGRPTPDPARPESTGTPGNGNAGRSGGAENGSSGDAGERAVREKGDGREGGAGNGPGEAGRGSDGNAGRPTEPGA